MIYATPTKHGSGIEIWGDINYLRSLYDTVRKLLIGEFSANSEGQRCQIISAISYEIRHAFQGDRLMKEEDENDFKLTYLGFRYPWISLLCSISALRYNAGYISLDKLDLANLNILEYWTVTALHAYDPKGAHVIELFVNARIDITNEYIYHLSQEIEADYAYMKANITRFRKIPDLLLGLSGHTEYNTKLMKRMEETVQELDVSNVYEIEVNYPELVW